MKLSTLIIQNIKKGRLLILSNFGIYAAFNDFTLQSIFTCTIDNPALVMSLINVFHLILSV